MEKYYTPTIEEFHIGFEFEKHDERHARYKEDEYKPTNWHKHKYNRDSIRLSQLDTHLHEKTIRVKHLDQEDIESLDWVYDVNYPFLKIDGDNTIGFSKAIDKFHYYRLILRGKKVLIYVNSPDGDEGLFRGIIKNKSELIKLLKQLGI